MSSPNPFKYKPTGSGRAPQTAAARIFEMVAQDLKTATQRLVHAASAVHELRRVLTRIHRAVVKQPLLLTGAVIDAIEADVQSGMHCLDIVSTSVRGISAKVTTGSERIKTGIEFCKEFPQPGLN